MERIGIAPASGYPVNRTVAVDLWVGVAGQAIGAGVPTYFTDQHQQAGGLTRIYIVDDKGATLLTTSQLQRTSITLMDVHGIPIVDSMPLVRFLPAFYQPFQRPPFTLVPFRWDAQRSYIKTSAAYPIPRLLRLMCQFQPIP